MKYNSEIVKNAYRELEIDLISDLNRMAYNYLTELGYTDVDQNRALYQFFNVQKRKIARKPRNIHKSKEFICPKDYKEAFNEFEMRAKNGDDLNVFMSEKLKEANYNDGLLNDWNIYHFHLTRQFRDDGWAKRSKYLIFAYVTDTDLYMLQVYKHKDNHVFAKQELVEIIHKNWPEFIEKNHFKGKPCVDIDEKGYNLLRKANISTFVTLNEDDCFGSIGGGYMSDGSSTEAMWEENKWKRLMKIVEKTIIANMELLIDLIKKEAENVTNCFRIQLLWIDNEQEFTLYEHNNEVVLQINLEKNQFRICDWLYVLKEKIHLR
ncbi:hypothetical protein AALA22_00090 [Anaerovoracaceae bacterium 41-7]|uniref:Uncharacterized protein n=1 Tax=Anaerotruncus colihominis TaxID=169435 RepID=A0A845QJR2_9FIRM|nr:MULTISPECIES: hypothetical protein [Anaerotruncus]MCI9639844.1 hypothetical protein [Emergencia sp.]NBH60927.1 hypothetical protein [Anaerotruncus colihominis]NCF01582.1 hypothetical protein [Anaerotruncus sp. 80]